VSQESLTEFQDFKDNDSRGGLPHMMSTYTGGDNRFIVSLICPGHYPTSFLKNTTQSRKQSASREINCAQI